MKEAVGGWKEEVGRRRQKGKERERGRPRVGAGKCRVKTRCVNRKPLR